MKKVALTFDDGPNPPYTNQILDILKKENIKATFFVCGTNIKRHPDVVKKEAQEGHQIGNHTYNHNYSHYPLTVIGAIYKDTIKTQKMIDEIAPQKEKLFRSPWFMAPPWLKNRLKREGFQIFGGIVGYEWDNKTTPQMVADKILSRVKDDSIIVLHDGFASTSGTDRSKTVKALPIIISALTKQGYEFVPLSQIKDHGDKLLSPH